MKYRFDLRKHEKGVMILAVLLFLLSLSLSPPVRWPPYSLLEYVIYCSIAPVLLVIALHEGLHAVVARLQGARVEFGITKLGKSWVAMAPYTAVRTPLPVKMWIPVLLAPFSLSPLFYILGSATGSPIWVMAFLINTSGLAGDIVVLLVLIRMPKDALVVDEGIEMVSEIPFPEPWPELLRLGK
ncbi:DUF3267 domain-containing protein [Pyrococcus yayanosii]|uniref:DUF3267 domain-containing protein n=1 Tax=Pyrococcus yayanosii (strain CH1 / JCM 16557) TaxID=529709 RepID=F8AGJ6_PYRYC|nr:DUF3267 domain-containing protein [Pyrococcus yayanosii]AEH23967.1 hypothetical protein PYCH_02680 [Pyrococcus yayanosii CH1]